MKKKNKLKVIDNDSENPDGLSSESVSLHTYSGYSSIKNSIDEEYFIDEEKHLRNGPLRQDNELFDEDRANICPDCITVKRVSFKDTEDWEIQSNKKTVLVLKGVRFTAKERKFFQTVHGMQFLVKAYKDGCKSVQDFKKRINDHI